MAHLLAAVAAFAWASVGAHAREAAPGSAGSLAQIRDTLGNLLRSIEDEGHDAEILYKKRQSWCSEVNKALDVEESTTSESLEQLDADLKEHEAAAEEAQGTVDQIQADIVLIQHTINQT